LRLEPTGNGKFSNGHLPVRTTHVVGMRIGNGAGYFFIDVLRSAGKNQMRSKFPYARCAVVGEWLCNPQMQTWCGAICARSKRWGPFGDTHGIPGPRVVIREFPNRIAPEGRIDLWMHCRVRTNKAQDHAIAEISGTEHDRIRRRSTSARVRPNLAVPRCSVLFRRRDA
jgi:hypothetical protein